ncbi:MAG: T9SS type A sorting domain-containing protein [Bacteroidetes bacterium]|nr:T9SS type A sorting domain-containing protein [Bacteroidota bacterium]
MKPIRLGKVVFTLSLFAGTQLVAQINPSDGCPTTAVLPVNTSCVANTYFMSGTFTNGALIAPTCTSGSDRDDGWYSFVATASSITIEEVSSDRTHLIQVRTACGGGTAVAGGCAVANPGVTNTVNLTGLTVGTTYYIQLQRRSGTNGNNMNGTICVYQTPNPDQPWPGANLGTLACTSTTTLSGNTGTETVDCSVSSAGDHIYQFTTSQLSDLTIDLCGSIYDTEVHLFSLGDGNCNVPALYTNDDGCGVQSSLYVSCLPVGTYVIVIEGSGTAEGAYTMDIILNNCGCPTPPPNDEPCTATALTVNTSCISVTDDNTNATASAVANPGCASYNGADLWYTAVVPAGGWLYFETTAGTITDGGLAIYSGTCAALTLIDCDDDSGTGNMSLIQNSTLTPGSTIYIRHWEFGGNFEGTYDICVYEPDCSANTTNDFCEDAGSLTLNPSATFSSSTASIYTNDSPDNVEAEFCGTIQNNSWYQFVATSTTHTFPISTVVGCTNGIQAEVYEFTGGSGSCCHSFTSMSNCYNPGNTSLGTVTATGLTVGNTYILMIDGYAGANCDFTITGWSATNILPVEIVDFQVKPNNAFNHLMWLTKSELNSKWFVIERSSDGENYVEIGKLDAAGNSSQDVPYFYKDYDFRHPKLYYRLKEIDYDGTVQYTESIMLMRTDVEVSVYPNPTSGVISINFYQEPASDYTIRYTDALGRVVVETIKTTLGNTTYVSSALVNLPDGIYFMEILDVSGGVVLQQKLIKSE